MLGQNHTELFGFLWLLAGVEPRLNPAGDQTCELWAVQKLDVNPNVVQ